MGLSNTLIRETCGERAYQRGNGYYRNRRVLKVEVKRQNALTWLVYAMVRGSQLYQQNIAISKDTEYFSGECSCPVGYNCKHVVAALLSIVDSDLLGQLVSHSNPVDEWLDQLGELDKQRLSGKDKESKQSQSGSRLLYLLETDSEVRMDLYVQPKKVRLLKSGDYGKAAAYSLEAPGYGYYSDRFLTPEDKDIAQLLDGQGDESDYYSHHMSSSRYKVFGDMGELALRKMLLSGR